MTIYTQRQMINKKRKLRNKKKYKNLNPRVKGLQVAEVIQAAIVQVAAAAMIHTLHLKNQENYKKNQVKKMKKR
jgi:hypothetical protein